MPLTLRHSGMGYDQDVGGTGLGSPVAHIASVLLTMAFLLMTTPCGAASVVAGGSAGGCKEDVMSLPLVM